MGISPYLNFCWILLQLAAFSVLTAGET